MEQIRLEAILASQREHTRLGTSLHQRIEIFDIIERAGIWLLFQPFQRLFGAYERQDAVAGIILNANHPLSLQRFTAAHEYGHHVLGHQSTIDDERSIRGARGHASYTEIAAYTFAAHFLMPLQLVNTVLKQMGLPQKPAQLAPRQAYLLALELGASYAAVVNHLVALRKISAEDAAELQQQVPKRIKAEIGRGLRPADAWADVWLLEDNDTGRLIYPRVNDQLLVSLRETPSTGYIWTVDAAYAPNDRGTSFEQGANEYVTLVSDEYEAPYSTGQSERFGGSGTRHLTFRVNRPGRYALRLLHRRPWQPITAPTEVFEVELEITPKRTGSSDRGVSEALKPLLAAA